MIKHLVMWRLKAGSEERPQSAMAQELKQRLEALKDAIPVIRELEVGLNMVPGERAADVVLNTTFENCMDLRTYREHPAHREVMALLQELVSETRVVDYEL